MATDITGQMSGKAKKKEENSHRPFQGIILKHSWLRHWK